MAEKSDAQSHYNGSGKRVAVVGAGVSGLAAAYKLKLHGVNVTLYEAEERAGGKLRSVSQHGLVWDEGANTMTESEIEVGSLLDNLRLQEKQQFFPDKIDYFLILQPISQNKRYIVRNGMPVLLPSNPIALIKSNILSAKSKSETLEGTAMTEELGVGGFFQRHFGKEVVDYLIDPFVAGTSGGDPESLSMHHTFPELWNLEKRNEGQSNHLIRFGSIIAGAVLSKLSAKREKRGETKGSLEKKKRQRGSFSFQGGMQTLTDTLCKELGKDKLRLKSKVLSLSYSHGEKSALENWSVAYASNLGKQSKDLSFDAVIMTAPLCNVREMKIMKKGNPFLLDFLPEMLECKHVTFGAASQCSLGFVPFLTTGSLIVVSHNAWHAKEVTLQGYKPFDALIHFKSVAFMVSYLPLSVIITTFKKENVKRPLEGFGVLVPSKEQQNGLKTLGTLFSSMMFPDRAPNDLYLYTTFIGGSRNRELAKASTDELKQIVTSDLRQLLGAEGEPTFVNHFYWSKAFPLLGHNYDSVLEAIDKMEKDLPGFFYAGNHKGGLSVGKAIASGCKAADLVISYLKSSSDGESKNRPFLQGAKENPKSSFYESNSSIFPTSIIYIDEHAITNFCSQIHLLRLNPYGWSGKEWDQITFQRWLGVLGHRRYSCGLSLESAVSASKLIHTRSREKSDSVLEIFTAHGRVVRYNLQKELVPNMNTLRAHGVPEPRIVSLIVMQPKSLFSRPDLFEKHELYMSFGWSEHDFRSAFVKQPMFMWCSEKKITAFMDFFVNKLGLKPSDVAKCPNLFLTSFVKRIIPRCSVVQVLISKGLKVKKNFDVVWILNLDKKTFETKFLIPFKDDAPEVIKAYQEAWDYKDSMMDCSCSKLTPNEVPKILAAAMDSQYTFIRWC
ncbi:Protoporphyrinogen oxidase, mitochondrial [Vitis vinifera]|uniref:protoporphyrinogen oxidase n=1 Tax=Vitis vinifera TaxID=29760 RepID=A0A438H7I8_VITVI|nr:Protoporphyrinogen oxidase, mitochondrial [Vitis vinifera]